MSSGQNVTLGGTGKEVGDRHPKIHDNVLIGASATILGNIVVGKGAQVAAGSLVLKPVPPHAMVAGSPAKEIGKVSGCPALKMEQWCKKLDAESNLFAKVDSLGISTCMLSCLVLGIRGDLFEYCPGNQPSHTFSPTVRVCLMGRHRQKRTMRK